MGAVSPAWIYPLALLLSLGLDRWSKAVVVARFSLHESLPLLPGLAFTYVRNPGAAFSLLAGAHPAWRVPFFLAVAAGAVALTLWYLRETPATDRLSRLALGLVAGGALGNAVDRARSGEVVDFIEVGVRGVYTWPVFNVADSAVSVGVCLLLWVHWVRPWLRSRRACGGK
jgi:signal peptidase II